MIAALAVMILALPSAAAQSQDRTPGGEWIDIEYQISYSGVTQINMDILMRVREVVHPDSGDATPANRIREDYNLLTANGQQDAADEYMEPFARRLQQAIESSLQKFDASGKPNVAAVVIDNTSLDVPPGEVVDDYHPSIRFRTTATIPLDRETLGLGDYTRDDIEAVLDAGAIIRSELSLAAEPGHTAWYNITPIAGAAYKVGPGHVPADTPPAPGSPMTFYIDNLDGTESVNLATWRELHAPDAGEFAEQVATSSITIDLRDVDITLMGAVGGDFGTMQVVVGLTTAINVMEVPADALARLPDTVALTHLPSDGLRRLNERGLITDDDLAKAELKLLATVKENLERILGGGVTVTGGFDPASLQGTPASGPLTGDRPLLFTASASFSKPLSGGGGSANAQAAMVLKTVSQTFSLPLLDGVETVYRFVLPSGFSLEDVTGTSVAVTTFQEDGRDGFTATPTDDNAKVTMSIGVTSGFVLAKFWPWVLLAVLIIVGLPMWGIARVMKKKKNSG